MYDKISSICCNGIIQSISNIITPQCCGNYPFDVSREICCSDKFKYPKNYTSNPQCCGLAVYDSSKYLCCQNVISIFIDNMTSPECCGNRGFDKSKYMCCEGIGSLSNSYQTLSILSYTNPKCLLQ